MKFEERLTELMNEVDVPDELSPQNIALMLKEKSSQSKMVAEHRNIKSAPSISAQRRTIIMRTVAATAACAVFAVGMWAYNENMAKQEQLEAPIEYEAVSPESYDELMEIYTGITLNPDGTVKNDTDLTIDETTQSPNEDGFGSVEYNGVAITDSDVVQSDDSYIYCLKDGMLYIISKDSLEIISVIECKSGAPEDIYIEGDKVILVYSETEVTYDFIGNAEFSTTASDVPADDADSISSAANDSDNVNGGTVPDNMSYKSGESTGESAIPVSAPQGKVNVVADVYDISSPENPVHTAAYKQNGSYTSSEIVDGKLYMVSAYSDYRVKPLESQADLDSFVPAYYFNGDKFFVKPSDIIVPSYANSTDYTVVSAIDVNENSAPTVKAVLGSNKNVYCSAETLYIAGVGRKDKEYSIISSFDLSDGGISYSHTSSVEGAVLGSHSMNEDNGMFRIATRVTDETGGSSVSVYVMDEFLTVVNGASKLCPEGVVTSVRFEGKYARIIDESGESAMVVDLAANPPTLVQSLLGSSAFLYDYSENFLLGVGKSEDGGLTLTMYDSATGMAANGIIFANNTEGLSSSVFNDKRAVLADGENGIIGVPVYCHNEFGTKNSYYVFAYDESVGFVQKGVIEYLDVDDSMVFLRGSVSGEVLYIMSEGRVISARLSDMKVIGCFEF